VEDRVARKLALSIAQNSLIILFGAGLSISDPSRVPLAGALVTKWIADYENRIGLPLPPEAKQNLEALADYFLQMHQLERSLGLVDWSPFVRDPNKGHFTIADFLACGVIPCALTTNVDFLVETAAHQLGEPFFQSALDGAQANQPHDHKPYLKLHGCVHKDLEHTVWTPKQISGPMRVDVIQQRVESIKGWLAGVLQGRDFLIIGFWTDWHYLNQVLAHALPNTRPATVTVVDIQTEQELQNKAPDLWQWCHQEHIDFEHVPADGAEFLAELRHHFSRTFIDRMYRDAGGGAIPEGCALPIALNNEELYDLRRDISGTPSNKPVREHNPQPHMNVVGRTHFALRAKGVVLNGSVFKTGDRTLRVVNGAGTPVSRVIARYERDERAFSDLIICAGADNDPTPPDIVRRIDADSKHIVRKNIGGRWITHTQAEEEGII
jgi:hypothetical protein